MSYSTIETAVAVVLRKHDDFDTTNVVQGSSSAIKKGLARAVRLLYGGHSRVNLTLLATRYVWTTNIDLYVPWRGSLETLETTFQTEFQKIIDTIEAWPNLGGTVGVSHAYLPSASIPEPLKTKNGAYRAQRLVLETTEDIVVTRSE